MSLEVGVDEERRGALLAVVVVMLVLGVALLLLDLSELRSPRFAAIGERGFVFVGLALLFFSVVDGVAALSGFRGAGRLVEMDEHHLVVQGAVRRRRVPLASIELVRVNRVWRLRGYERLEVIVAGGVVTAATFLDPATGGWTDAASEINERLRQPVDDHSDHPAT